MQFSRAVLLLAPALVAAADSTTYIGDAFSYRVSAMALDGNGNTFLTGSRAIVVPAPDAQGGPTLTDVFVAKLDAARNLTLLATVSAKASAQANSIAVDSSGNIYIVGSTAAADFPLLHPLQSSPSASAGVPNIPAGATGFLMKFRADGTVLYSTYLGGTAGASVLNAVAADAHGNAYVAGETSASDYPRAGGLPASITGGIFLSAAFFAKISPAGDQILYAGGIGATNHACGQGSSCFLSPISNAATSIAVDSDGNAYLAGNTFGAGLGTTPGALKTDGIGAFVAKVNAAGSGLVYLTLLGTANDIPPGGAVPGSNPGNRAYAIAADAAGNAYLAGSTTDPNFPATASAFQRVLAVPNPPVTVAGIPKDAFVAKLNPAGSALVWATFLGGTGIDAAGRVAVDSAGNAWVSGTTLSADFPASLGVPALTRNPGREFLAEFNSSGSSLLYAAQYPVNTVGTGIAPDPAGVIHLSGGTGLVSTLTPGQIASPHVFGLTNAAFGDLTGRIAPGEVISIYGLHLGPATPVVAAFDANGLLPTSLGGVRITVNDTAAPLIYVSDQQINAVVPFEASAPVSAVRISTGGTTLPDFRAVVDAAIPEPVRISGAAAAAINQDGTVNSQTNPAPAGSYVSLWGTGLGIVAPGLTDGQMAQDALDFHLCCVHDVANGTELSPSYFGAAPGFVAGVFQLNFQVTNSSAYYLDINTKSSALFSLFVGR